MKVELSFYNDTEEKKYNKAYFLNIAKIIFDHLKLDSYFIFEVNLVSLEEIHRINLEYRNVDRPTDVISFAFEDNMDGISKIILKKGMPRNLGEIFICVEKAKMQALEYGHSTEREMSFLFTHGLLHLLGYDHMNEEDEKVMFKLQDEIMEIMKL